jgi:hypothetical protein
MTSMDVTRQVLSPGLFGAFRPREITYQIPRQDLLYRMGLRQERHYLRNPRWENRLKVNGATRHDMTLAAEAFRQVRTREPLRVKTPSGKVWQERVSPRLETAKAMAHLRQGLRRGGVAPEFLDRLPTPWTLGPDTPTLATLAQTLAKTRNTAPLEAYFNRISRRNVVLNRGLWGSAVIGLGVLGFQQLKKPPTHNANTLRDQGIR